MDINNKIIIFNWKMNPDSKKEAEKLFNIYLKSKISSKNKFVVAPPFVYLPALSSRNNLSLAAQDIFWKESGAFTGEISPQMIKDFGVEYVIIGHSERRKNLGETDKIINEKILFALKEGLKVIFCVGEDLEIRKNGLKVRQEFIKNQLLSGLDRVHISSRDKDSEINELIIAYEPIWAISTNINSVEDSPEDALKMSIFIKEVLSSKFKNLKFKVLYGGSVDGQDIKDFIKYKEIDGALVGGASLKKEEIKKILSI